MEHCSLVLSPSPLPWHFAGVYCTTVFCTFLGELEVGRNQDLVFIRVFARLHKDCCGASCAGSLPAQCARNLTQSLLWEQHPHAEFWRHQISRRPSGTRALSPPLAKASDRALPRAQDGRVRFDHLPLHHELHVAAGRLPYNRSARSLVWKGMALCKFMEVLD